VTPKVRERLEVSKRAMQKFGMERFHSKKLNEEEGKEQYQVKISNRFAALENSDDDVDIERTGETSRQNIKASTRGSQGYYEFEQHTPWFDEGCSKPSDQRKQVKFQWLKDSNRINGDNLNNVKT
jgi:hypothetical protein